MLPSDTPPLQLINQYPVKGFLHGFQQPCLRVLLHVRPMAHKAGEVAYQFAPALQDRLTPMPDGMHPELTPDLASRPWAPRLQPQVWPLLEALNQWLVRLQETAGLPVASGFRCELIAPLKPGSPLLSVVLAIPGLSPAAISLALRKGLEPLNAMFSGKPLAFENLETVLSLLKGHAPAGSNNRLLLKAAYRLGVPCIALARDHYQYGWGSRARWLKSTLSDATPGLGLKIARDKVATNQLFKMAGIPVTTQVEVNSLERALQASEALGYPVVVKPADQDGGLGARANLHNKAEVEAAFHNARPHSARILVEKHVRGNEYRLTVVNGKLFWAHQRVPASVTGDGASTLQALIDRENAKRRSDLERNPDGLSLIRLEASDLDYLSENQTGLDTVPCNGQVVRLQRVPRSRDGGGGISHLEDIHPDNKWLAERAASLLRMDIAGVDLLTEDIRRSWREIGGAVTEINAIPQISSLTFATLHDRLLSELIEGDGRVPVVVVLQNDLAPHWVKALKVALEQSDLCAGVSMSSGLTIGANVIRQSRDSAFEDVRCLQLAPEVQAIVVVTDGREFLKKGLPFDRFDVLLMAEKAATSDNDQAALKLLSPSCSRTVLVTTGEVLGEVEASGNGITRISGHEDGLSALLERIIQGDILHRNPKV